MTSIRYMEKVVAELGDLIKATWTGGKTFEKVNDKYESLRRRVIAFEPIVGAPPKFVVNAENLWVLWGNVVKDKLTSYEDRREYLDRNYFSYYTALIGKIASGTFEQEMLHRDLAIVEQIGEGGFGVVYEAEHIVLGGSRAIKKLEPIFVDEKGEENALRRFAREAEILDELHHPNIVKFYDAGISAGYPFIVLEYVDGQNLKDYVSENGVFSEDVALNIMRQVASAVSDAHKSNVVHRDIKPTNIMWDGSRAVVLDYGAGQWLEHQLSTRMTTSVVGTSGYIANELLEDPTLLSHSLDCFSLGVVFHFLLTGRTPSVGDPTHYLKEAGATSQAQAIILTALSPPKQRYKNGKKLLAALMEDF